MSEYSNDELVAIYELGRLYFEMGYFAAAERIFSGLCTIDQGRTPARLGLGLVKLERGLFAESVIHFRFVLQEDQYTLQGSIALAIAFIAQGEFARAKSLLQQGERRFSQDNIFESELRKLWEALVERCKEEG